MYCVIKCTVRGKQARVKNADLRHPSGTVVMQRRKSASPVHIVLKYVVHALFEDYTNTMRINTKYSLSG